ncbi:DNA polymerase IV [Aromatoleum bremense]|uniref:DNA polymerase IV n=1 Tax=Aromatoleum bremense TaxID=76115 RepID=A0ABX1NS29_9RHOO|nr:DNA polymerase IV [Aromatoleum bremense]NMG14784.1 DNA polymerase IV [Aromatoleum bremense]QTQ30943.1 DNA polymerase IV [Aromatoleum bremense]
MSRKIIHCDCDCFYAAVEMRDDPSLVGRPLAVGGKPGERGVVATCNYEARAFGVRSAMSSAHALRLCPHLLLLPPDFTRYRAASRQILAIYREYTALVEPLSLDEAYLDVTAVDRCRGSATLMAQEIRSRIHDEVGITASAGIAPNKFVAKVASDWRKPNGQFVVRPEEVDAFVAELPVKKIFGVGKVTAERLLRLGVETCGDLRGWSLADLTREFGSFGANLHRLCRGIDDRPVAPDRERKSLSVETTYNRDLPDLQACLEALPALVEEFSRRMTRLRDGETVHKVFVKVKFSDFTQTTAECVDPAPVAETWTRLLAEGHRRRGLPVRLLGVGVRFAACAAPDPQLPLFADADGAE